MAKYLLVSFKTCPWVQRAAIVLREKNVDFEFRHIDPDNRPDWFLAISPHKKVPVLRVDDRVSLFESNAIAEYLDETLPPRLHPEDPVERAVNRAWTDYVPTFAEAVTATAYADTEADYNKAAEKIPLPFERLEKALAKQGGGPYFNGAKYSLVDAAYAPFLQRYFFLDGVVAPPQQHVAERHVAHRLLIVQFDRAACPSLRLVQRLRRIGRPVADVVRNRGQRQPRMRRGEIRIELDRSAKHRPGLHDRLPGAPGAHRRSDRPSHVALR
jgi:glutathione S-transferase